MKYININNMNKLIEKKESKSLDLYVVLKNLEYLKDHLVI